MSQESLLKNALRISLGIHAGALLFLLSFHWIFPEETRILIPTLRVDLVSLPDLKKDEPPSLPASAPEPAPPPKAAAEQPPPRVVPATKEADHGEIHLPEKKPKKKQASKKEKAAEKKLKSAIARIRAIERIKALAGNDEVKGNRISKGTALTGEALQSLEAGYFDVILERVRSYWELPKWLREQNRSAKVMIRLDFQGRIRSFEFVQSSGSAPFDAEVRRALQAAAPFPIPPQAISAGISKQGILLGFPL